MTDVLIQKHNYIKQTRQEQWKVCVYGLGYLGQRLYRLIPSIFDLTPDVYSDGNDEKVDVAGYDDISGVYKRDLLTVSEPVLVFILADNPIDKEIEKTLSENRYLHTVSIREVIQMDETVRSFYGDDLYAKYKKLEEYSQGKVQ